MGGATILRACLSAARRIPQFSRRAESFRSFGSDRLQQDGDEFRRQVAQAIMLAAGLELTYPVAGRRCPRGIFP